MIVKCSSCGAANNIADDKVKGRRVKVRCKSCGTRLVVDATSDVAKTIAASEVSKSSPPPRVAGTPQKPGPSLPPARASATPRPVTTAATLPARAGTVKPAAAAAPVRTAAGALAAPRPGTPAAKLDPSADKTAEAESPWWINLGESDEQNMTLAEIVSGWQAGTISEDAYVWREGWDDWLPVLDVAELKAAIDAGARGEPAAAAATPKPARPSAFPRAPAAFPAAGGKEPDELEVDIDAGDMDAAANAVPESSAQLSLQALKAEMQPAAAPKKPEPQRPKSLDEILGLGSGATAPAPLLAFGTADLATAPAPPPPKPEPVVPVSIPAPAATGVRRTLPVLLAMFAAMAIGGLAVAVILLSGQQKTAKTEATDAGASAVVAKPSAAEADAATKPEEKKDQAAADASATATTANKTAPVTDSQAQKSTKTTSTSAKRTASSESHTQSSTTTKKSDTKSSSTAKAEPPVEVKDKPSSGVASFDKKAAAAALSTVASQCTACRRLDGPKGSGRALVTFATSGRVTGVQVVGGAFQGTRVGSCVAGVFRRAKVPSFSGSPVTVSKSFTIPE
jgi:predicted Zn finger-like uncharacterized protein